jgi:hypothetical protein
MPYVNIYIIHDREIEVVVGIVFSATMQLPMSIKTIVYAPLLLETHSQPSSTGILAKSIFSHIAAREFPKLLALFRAYHLFPQRIATRLTT